MDPSDSRRRKRRIFLLLSAILIPAAVLITLAVRVVRQEAELAERRAVEERRDALDQLRRELSARLQAIKLQEVNRLIGESGSGLPPDSPIVFVTPLGQDRMVLPWEEKRTSPPPSAEFARYQLEGESFEFRADDVPGAVTAYRQALNVARGPAEKCQAQLWLGRAFSKDLSRLGSPADLRRLSTACRASLAALLGERYNDDTPRAARPLSEAYRAREAR